MKKIIALLLVICAILLLAACGGKENDQATPAAADTVAPEEPTAEVTAPPEDTQTAGESEPQASEESEETATSEEPSKPEDTHVTIDVVIPDEYVGTWSIMWGNWVTPYSNIKEFRLDKNGTLAFNDKEYQVDELADDGSYVYSGGNIVIKLTPDAEQPVDFRMGLESFTSYKGLMFRKIGSGEKKTVELTTDNWQDYLTPTVLFEMEKDGFGDPTGEVAAYFCLAVNDSIDLLGIENGLVKGSAVLSEFSVLTYDDRTGKFSLESLDETEEIKDSLGNYVSLGKTSEIKDRELYRMIDTNGVLPDMVALLPSGSYMKFLLSEEDGIFTGQVTSKYAVDIQKIRGTITYVEKD